MSTTHVQSLPNVRGRMSYTEFGEGKRRREHLENGTDRIAAQMGDAASREDFIVYCEGQKHRHPNAVNEGYEVRISWATDELDPSRQDDIQQGMEYAYTLCHELAPDSMCWVTMHVDGEGGCVHAHATIANHDARSGQVINKEDTSLYAPRVQAVNDRLSRENGFQVLSRADIGIAMGAMGSDAAIEAADIVLMDDDPRKIAKAIDISRKTLRIVRQNIVFALGVKLVVLLLGALGMANMWEAVFADVGVSVIAIINAMRAMRISNDKQ